MFFKKLNQWAAAVMLTTATVAAVAGSPAEQQTQQQEATPAPSKVGLYSGFMVGGFYRNMKENFELAAAVKKSSSNAGVSWDAGLGGYTLGLDIGYRFTDELSLEIGTFYLQPQNMKFTTGNGVNGSSGTYCNSIYCYANGSYAKVSTWATYVGIKAQTDVFDQLSVYTKLAAAYVDNRYRINLAPGSQLVGGNPNVGTAASDSTYWAPVIAFGVEYDLSPKCCLSLQYMLVLSGNTLANDPSTVDNAISTINNIALPAIHLFTLGFDYRFLT